MRKISAHFFLDNKATLRKYPIICIDGGVIISIECHDALPEIAGLEFYSGIILPHFVDVILLDCAKNIVSPSVLSPLVAEMVALTTQENSEATTQIANRTISVIQVDDTNLEIACTDCGISVVAKINKLVKSGFFTDALEGLNYFTRDLSRCYFKSPREVAVGCTGEFLLCSDMLFIQTGIVNELKISALR